MATSHAQDGNPIGLSSIYLAVCRRSRAIRVYERAVPQIDDDDDDARERAVKNGLPPLVLFWRIAWWRCGPGDVMDDLVVVLGACAKCLL